MLNPQTVLAQLADADRYAGELKEVINSCNEEISFLKKRIELLNQTSTHRAELLIELSGKLVDADVEIQKLKSEKLFCKECGAEHSG